MHAIYTSILARAGLSCGNGAIVPSPPLQWGPRDDIYVF